MAGRGRLRVRKAGLKDLDALVAQRRGMWEDMGIKGDAKLSEADRVYKSWARKQLKNGTLKGWVAENRDGAVVAGGCLWLRPVQPSPGFSKGLLPYLMSMYTQPDYRGRGIASQIVKEAVRWTKNNGYTSMRLHASEMGRGVYRNLGFVRSWEMKWEPPKRSPNTPRAARV